MTTIVKQKITFEEFLTYEDDTDYLYELEDGELLEMSAESEINRRIASFLFGYLIRAGFADCRLSMKTEVAVPSTMVNVRIPDLVVFSEELAQVMEGAKRSLVMLDMPNPDLIVEVVSPNQDRRDYCFKRTEYCARRIPEYWIVDPIVEKVTTLEWLDGFYDEKVFQNNDLLGSHFLGDLELRASQLLTGGRV